MTVIRGVGVISLGKCLGTFYALVGIVLGALTSTAMLLLGPRGANSILGKSMHLGEFDMGGMLLLVAGACILYGIAGFAVGIVSGVLANLALRLGGGVEVKLE
ncbi:hypothetical protein QEG98_34400 [Myxococcus sp. MxC21-1]|uniref:hypothetical protein n=1 Tax=Myxococcus sp. MxC21-1 TaxID=3041439 RepID=UPI00292F6113|nr:hypothetical protein [Myxococcus sp. MxC21-1]WNZ60965.1 hypothetical protein QEG98_34400 [Myxococcus sp. MxC21-1]